MGLLQAFLTLLFLFIVTTRSQSISEAECAPIDGSHVPVASHCESLVTATELYYRRRTIRWPLHYENDGCQIGIFPIDYTPEETRERIHEDLPILWNQRESPTRGRLIRWHNIIGSTRLSINACFPPGTSNTHARIYTIGYRKAGGRPAVVEVELMGWERGHSDSEGYSSNSTRQTSPANSQNSQPQIHLPGLQPA